MCRSRELEYSPVAHDNLKEHPNTTPKCPPHIVKFFSEILTGKKQQRYPPIIQEHTKKLIQLIRSIMSTYKKFESQVSVTGETYPNVWG